MGRMEIYDGQNGRLATLAHSLSINVDNDLSKKRKLSEWLELNHREKADKMLHRLGKVPVFFFNLELQLLAVFLL